MVFSCPQILQFTDEDNEGKRLKTNVKLTAQRGYNPAQLLRSPAALLAGSGGLCPTVYSSSEQGMLESSPLIFHEVPSARAILKRLLGVTVPDNL